MDKVYVYEPNFSSLLNLIVYLAKFFIKPDRILPRGYQPNLLEEIIDLEIPKQDYTLCASIYKIMYYVYLSTEENKELILYYFYLNYCKYQEKVLMHRNLKCVNRVLKISHYVSQENHKYKGFLRFKELEHSILYAEIEPVNNIIDLLSMHFLQRLKNEFWIIKDVHRGILSIYDKKNYYLLKETEFFISLQESKKNQEFENLWKTFYKTIGIQERKNERCRMNFMPKKYWKYMLEMESEL